MILTGFSGDFEGERDGEGCLGGGDFSKLLLLLLLRMKPGFLNSLSEWSEKRGREMARNSFF